MTIEKIMEILKELSKKNNDEFSIPVKINSRLTKSLGKVKFIKDMNGYCEEISMEFSKRFLENSTEEEITQVVMHEWVHYFIIKTTHKNHGHDNYFKSICRLIGCKNDKATVCTSNDADNTMKYTIYCEGCNLVLGGYVRMCKTIREIHLYHCKKCGGKLAVKQNY